MSEEKYPVQLSLGDGRLVDATLIFDDGKKDCCLSLAFGNRVLTESDADYFEALRKIRLVLEREGIKVNCYGASKNVWPSGMSRDMGGGIMAHRLTLGEKGNANSLVHIFETGSDFQPATVEEQEAFFDQWLKSIGIDRERTEAKPISYPRGFRFEKWVWVILLGLLASLGIFQLLQHL